MTTAVSMYLSNLDFCELAGTEGSTEHSWIQIGKLGYEGIKGESFSVVFKSFATGGYLKGILEEYADLRMRGLTTPD